MDYTKGFMQDIEIESKTKNASSAQLNVASTQLSGFEKQSLTSVKQETSTNISKTLCEEMLRLIKDVNKNGVTPESISASCKAGEVIHKILRLNYEMKANGL